MEVVRGIREKAQRGRDGAWGDTTMGKGSSVGKLMAMTLLPMDVGRGLVQLTSPAVPNLCSCYLYPGLGSKGQGCTRTQPG